MITLDLAQPVTPYQLTQIVFQVVGVLLVVFGLLFTAVQLNRNRLATQVGNLIALVKNHREIWTMAMDDPELRKVLSSDSQVIHASELNDRQRYFVNFLVLHMSAAYEMSRTKTVTDYAATQIDMGSLLILPAVNAVWSELAPYHNRRFRRYVDKGMMLAQSGKGCSGIETLRAQDEISQKPGVSATSTGTKSLETEGDIGVREGEVRLR